MSTLSDLADGLGPTVWDRNQATSTVPTVEGGSMNILYFLPGGAIEFGPR